MNQKRPPSKIKPFQLNKNALTSKLSEFIKSKNTLLPLKKKSNVTHKSNVISSITLYNNKKTSSQFLNYKSSKRTNNKAHFTSTSFKFASLDTSPKNAKSHSSSVDYENTITELKKEIDKLTAEVKSQKEFIEKLVKENQKKDKELIKTKEIKNKIVDKYEELKDNQEQLILLIKIIDKSGVDLEKIIDEWNKEVEEEYEERFDNSMTKEDDAINSINNSGDSFVPLTIGNIQIQDRKKEILKGIPKLKFDKLDKGKQGRHERQEQNVKRKRNGPPNIIGNTYHSYSNDDKNMHK